MSQSVFPSACLALALLAGSALAQPTMFIASRDHALGSGKDAVPGFPGFQFVSYAEGASSKGSDWVAHISVTIPGILNTQDQVVLVGDGATYSVVAREGVTVVGSGGQLLNLSASGLPRINDAGEWTMAVNPATGQPGLVIKSNVGSTAYTTVGIEGALSPYPVGGTPNAYGRIFASASITDAGVVSFQNDAVGAFAGFTVNFAGSPLAPVAIESETGVTAGHSGVLGGLVDALSFGQTSRHLHVSADGSIVAYRATVGTGGPAPVMSIIVNDQVVAQVGGTLPGGTDSITALSELWMEPVGDVFIRGEFTGGIDFIARNGVVIAREGTPITPGATENWTQLAFVRGDSAGNTIVVGFTNAVSTANELAVINGERVLLREGDPIELDGDNDFSDGLFVSSIRSGGFITADGFFYAPLRIRGTPTGTNLTNNSSLVRVPLAPPCPCPLDYDNSGSNIPDIDDLVAFFNDFNDGLSDADVNCTGAGSVPDIDDVLRFFDAFAGECP